MSLRLKTILGIVAMEAVLLLVLVLYTLSNLRDAQERALAQRAHASVELFSGALKNAVLGTDLATIHIGAEEMLRRPDVVYARVESRGRRLVEVGDAAALGREFVADRSVASVDDGVFDTMAPVREGAHEFGRVELGFSTASIERALARRRTQIIGIALVSLLVVACVSFLLGTYLTRRLAELERATNAIASGDSGVRVDVRGADEIGRTMRAFNEMSRHLEESRAALEEALGAARAASEAKSRFLAVMSHELRTPLAGLLGSVELLRDSALAGDAALHAENAQAAGEALMAVISDVLDFSKIEAGKLTLERGEFDVWEMVEGTVRLLAASAHAKGVEVSTCITAQVPHRLVGDGARVRQILINLVGNAIKFTTAGGISVVVERAAEEAGDQDGIALVIQVRDTGIGIPAERLAELFNEFSQVESGNARNYGGTGLGLAICDRLAALMGGTISVSSEVGVGSCFTVLLRLEGPSSAASGVWRPGHWDTSGEAEDLARYVVLCEPNAVTRDTVARQLRELGVTVATASTGMDALALLAQGMPAVDTGGGGDGPDAVLVADQLPDMSVDALLDRAAELVATPWLVLTRLRSAGEFPVYERARGVLRKPLTVERLRHTLTHRIRSGNGPMVGSRSSARMAAVRILTTWDGRAPRVLVVEDNHINRVVLRAMLVKSGCDVDLAMSGEEAVVMVRASLGAERYDFVLMDLSMPGMDGIEATRRIRALDASLADMPIIAVTANVMAGERERCFAAGMNDYFCKPLERDALFDALEAEHLAGPAES